MLQYLLIATAGHVDHGKSTLVRNLTGIDPDRWAEEKVRGITIDLGYAVLKTPGRVYSFVDVPGHERFIHNMLAGVGSIDAVLLVIAADESIMPQTREHARALHFLGTDQVGIIVTKSDLVDADLLELVHQELDEWLTDFGWESAPRAVISAQQPETMQSVLALLAKFEPKPSELGRFFRLPVDRVFTSTGSGTVITGAVANGSIDKTSSVVCLPHLKQSRIRQIQVHEEPVDRAHQHQRAALNLPDLHHSQISRGDFLFAGISPILASRVLVRLAPFQEWDPARKHRFHCHYFSAHFMASLVWQEAGIAMLHFEQPHCFWALDKGLLRDGSPLKVVAGFVVLHPNPPVSRKKFYRPMLERLATLHSTHTWVNTMPQLFPGIWDVQTMEAMTGAPFSKEFNSAMYFLDEKRFLAKNVFDGYVERGLHILNASHRAKPYFSFLSLTGVRSSWIDAAIPAALHENLLGYLQKRGDIVLSEDRLKATQHSATWRPRELSALDHILGEADSETSIIDLRTIPKDPLYDTLINLLVWEKYLTQLSPELLILTGFLNQILPQMAAAFHGSLLQVGDLKSQLNITRKLAIPLLEWLDKNGYTVREKEGRRWLPESPPLISWNWQLPNF